MESLSIDLETYSDIDLKKCGVYKYAESPNFEILLFAYSVDNGPVQVIDLAQGEDIPTEILAALTDETITKWAYNTGCFFMSKLGLSPFSNTYPLSADDETPLRKNNFKKFSRNWEF